MGTRNCYLFSAAALGLACAANTAHAAPVTDWHAFSTTSITLSGQGTDDPVFGSFTANPPETSTSPGTPNSAQNGFLIGYFDPITLTNVGDFVTMSYNVKFNDDVGMTSGGDNFRFALYDLNGESKVTADTTVSNPAGTTQTDDFRGYWVGTKGTGAGANGSTRERINSTSTNTFANATSASITDTGFPGGTAITFVSDVDSNGAGEIYTGSLTITKTATGIKVTGSFTDPSGPTNSFSGTDDTTPSPATFGALGFLNGGGISADQVILGDVTVTTNVPEPAALALLGLGGLALLRRPRSGR